MSQETSPIHSPATSLTPASTQLTLGTAQALLTGLGFKDLQPSLYAAEQAEQLKAQPLAQALQSYLIEPDNPAIQRHLSPLLSASILDLQIEIARLQLQQQTYQKAAALESSGTASASYLSQAQGWVLSQVKSFFGSTAVQQVEKYAALITKRNTQLQESRALLAELDRLTATPSMPPATVEPEVIEVDTAQLKKKQAAEGLSKVTSRRLLQTQTPPQTTAEFCGTTSQCDLRVITDGESGIALLGEAPGDKSGFSVSAGDFNGDGIDDLLIGAPYASPYNLTSAGNSYVVFGTRNTSAWGTGRVNLSMLMDGLQGFVVQGEASSTSGYSVSSADINGDDIDDLLIGAPNNSPAYLSYPSYLGNIFVVFGTRNTSAWGSGRVTISMLMDGLRGFALQSETPDLSGVSVSGADINGDDIDDLLIGAPAANPYNLTYAGNSHVVFGTRNASAWGSGRVTISMLMDGLQGFVLQGETLSGSGYSVSGADINGDDIDDLLIGARYASPSNLTYAGNSYILFGTRNVSAWGNGRVNLTTLANGIQGFALQGEATGDQSGSSVSTAGDINGDGISDLVIGAYAAHPYDRFAAGKSHVVFGTRNPAVWGNGQVKLSDLMDGIQGFVLQGGAQDDNNGYSVSRVGDINGDDIDDVVVGSNAADPAGRNDAGKSYIVFGSTDPTAWGSGRFDLSTFSSTIRGIELQGETLGARSGWSVHSAGDFNGDGQDDLVLGAPYAQQESGVSYVFWGSGGEFTANYLQLAAGDSTRLTTDMLAFTDTTRDPLQERLLVESVSHGAFTYIDQPSVELRSFYYQNISDQQVQFIQDGSGLAPAYRLRIQFKSSFSIYSDAQVDFLGFRPLLDNNELFVAQGLVMPVSGGSLSATDRDDPLGSLQFVISNLTHGHFQQVNASGAVVASPITLFSQQDQLEGRIQFVHDGERTPPSYRVAVRDSKSTTDSVPAFITFNYAPELRLSPIVVDQGQPTLLRPQDMVATDVETFGQDLIIEAANVSYGRFVYSSNPTYALDDFRQLSMISGGVQFIQDGSGNLSSFALRTFDGQIHSPWQTATVQLNHRPIAVSAVADQLVTQDEAFAIPLPQPLFSDADGDTLTLSAQLAGGAPLPSGLSFEPSRSRFTGRLPTPSSYRVEVQATDPRGLRASTDFTLQARAASASTGINLSQLYSGLSTVGGIVGGLAAYLWWRRRITKHREDFAFANYLREASNLEYHDFMRFGGDTYKTVVQEFLLRLNITHEDFFNKLPGVAQQKAFAVCVKEILEKRGLVSASGYTSGLYGYTLFFSMGWSNQLDLTQFSHQMKDIADEAVATWQQENQPLTRWVLPSPTLKDHARACCPPPRPSRAGFFARSAPRSDLEPIDLTVRPDGKTATGMIETPAEIQQLSV